ncbi:glycoside hydrolase family 19 protein [Azohydromonas australica]|uniref:glycoside hydrolase family 19 protein n=1 Tax=Azohydromonas australica TaxID=364039 RepID=UPI0003F741FF|nr:glycoside hydrolase family 19 protein [Azohydromonas australica]
MITAAILGAAEPGNSDLYYQSILGGMNKYAAAYGINTKLRVAHFLAQIAHESGLKTVEESGNYSTERMHQIFGCKGGSKNYDAGHDDCKLGRLREKLWTEQARCARNSKNLLGYVYANRLGNGDEVSGDGFRYRGRGMIQLTGKTNYKGFTNSHNARNPDDPRDFVERPELLIDIIDYGVESAFYFWDSRPLNAAADADDVVEVTRLINGGDIGLPDRKARLARIKAAM